MSGYNDRRSRQALQAMAPEDRQCWRNLLGDGWADRCSQCGKDMRDAVVQVRAFLVKGAFCSDACCRQAEART